MMASMPRQLKVLLDQIGRVKLLYADQRVAKFLIGLHRERGIITLVLPHEQILIAQRIRTQPQTFSRAIVHQGVGRRGQRQPSKQGGTERDSLRRGRQFGHSDFSYAIRLPRR